MEAIYCRYRGTCHRNQRCNFPLKADEDSWDEALSAARSAVSEVVFRYVKIVKACFSEVFVAKIAVEHGVGFVKPFGKFSRAERSESEAHVFRRGMAARLPFTGLLNVGFHLGL